MFNETTESGKLLRSDRIFAGIIFALLMFASIAPTGVFHGRSNEVYGYSTRRSGSIVFHTPSKTVEEKKDELTEDQRERLQDLQKRLDNVMDLFNEALRSGKFDPSAPIKTGDPYIIENISFGANNNPNDVRRLQSFLNRHMGSGLSITGNYDRATMEAVKDFQLKYAEYILEPWGISEPTGFVYLTTKRMINALENPHQYFPMPRLVPYSQASTGRVASYYPSVTLIEETEEEVIEEGELEEGEIVVEVTEDDDFDWDDEEEGERGSLFLWTVIILSAIGFAVVVYQMRSAGRA